MLFKFLFYIIYGIAVFIFIYYIKLSYIFNLYYDRMFTDFKNMSRFDYIIVGAGSAGSVIAAQLSKAGAKTLLIEAGGKPTYFFDIPVIAPMLMNTEYDWQYITVPQENACKALNNNQSIWPAGKILGGSSRLNYMVYNQGHTDDYNSWFEDFREPIVEKEGSLYVDQPQWYSKVSNAILEGIQELSYPLKNINDLSSTGFMRAHLTLKNGKRWSTDKIIYQNLNKRLIILTNSFVKKILFKSNKAIGIEFLKDYNTYRAFAKKGVIVSAGAVGTPKLLMLSGVGPYKDLKKLNIKVIADLPVGQYLVDHIITGLDLVTLKYNKALSIADVLNPISLIEYFMLGRGPWTFGGVDIIGTFHSKLKQNKSSIPDLQIMTIPLGISQDNGILLRKNLGISEKIFEQYFAPLTYKTAITIAPVLLHPKSNGEIKLRSSNPFDPPIINPKYLSNEEDVLTLIEGIEFVKKLINTKVMREFGAQLYEKPFPGCENINFDTTDYWKCYVKHMTFTTYHPAGTCRMGEVVDFKFRVINTKNLFVVDASVFPKLPSGNTHAPVVMLAEKASQLIIEDFKNNNLRSNKCYRKEIFFITQNRL